MLNYLILLYSIQKIWLNCVYLLAIKDLIKEFNQLKVFFIKEFMKMLLIVLVLKIFLKLEIYFIILFYKGNC